MKSNQDYRKAISILKLIPNSTNDDQIEDGTDMLIRLNILDKNKSITLMGKAVLDLPVTNHPKMCAALYHALKTYTCGLDLIALSTAVYLT